MNDFACEARKVDDMVVVDVRGEVDLATSDQLAEVAGAHLTPGARVVLDCSRITFMDSCGLRALVQLRLQAEEAGAVFLLAALPASVRRVLDLSGTLDVFGVLDDAGQSHSAGQS